jgi:hypothetical protein
MFKKKKV